MRLFCLMLYLLASSCAGITDKPKQINGVPLISTDEAVQLLQELEPAKELEATVTDPETGRSETLKVPIDEEAKSKED